MAAPTITTVSIPSNGVQMDLTFSESVSGVTVTDYSIKINGYNVLIRSVSGSGTSWSLILARSFYSASDTVTLDYFGTGTVNGTSTPLAPFTNRAVSNSSTVGLYIRKYCDQQFKTFFHFSGKTFFGGTLPTQGQVNAFDCPNFDMDQWLDTAKNKMRVSAVCLTTKHDFGFSCWPTAQANFNIGTTVWNTRTPGIDVVSVFTTKARALGLMVGLYYNLYDPWWISVRAGSDGTYSQNLDLSNGFTAYVNAHLTELLSNYGTIDFIWLDSWEYRTEIGYVNANYAAISGKIHELQPNCVMLNNVGLGSQSSLAHTQVCVQEGNPGFLPPDTSNTMPYEFTETSSSLGGGYWTIPPAPETGFLDPAVVAGKIKEYWNTRRCVYLYNLMPTRDGTLPPAMVAHCQQVGEALFPSTGLPSRSSAQLAFI